MNDLLLQNEKLMWAQEEKSKIMAAISTSLPVTAKEAAPCQVSGVPGSDATIITGVTISFSGEFGTSTGEVSPQSLGFVRALAPPYHWITSKFLHPLALPANCLSDSDWDSASDNEMGSGSSNSSGRQLSEVHPLRFPGSKSEPLTKGHIQGLGPDDQLPT